MGIGNTLMILILLICQVLQLGFLVVPSGMIAGPPSRGKGGGYRIIIRFVSLLS